jgi:hypothetical protein
MRKALPLTLLLILTLADTVTAVPALRIVTWDSSRGRDDMILTDTMEGKNIEYVYNDLMKPSYFGPSGVVRCTPDIRFVSSIAGGSLVSGGVRQADVFFGNQIDPNEPVIPLSAGEAAELASFINAGGVVYVSGLTNGQGAVWNGLFTALGISDHFNSDSHCSGSISLPLVTTPFTDGPFGTVGYMGWPCFGSIENSSLTPVIKAGGTPPTYVMIAEGAFGAGRLSVSGGVIAHDTVSGNASTRRYLLNMFAHGCQAPNLQIYQTVTPEVASPGQPIAVTLYVSNQSGAAINDVRVSTDIPAQLTNPSFTGSGLTLTQEGSTPYTWHLGTLEAGTSGTITVSATVSTSVTATSTLTIPATISGTDGQTTVSDSSSVTISAQDCYATSDEGVTVHRSLQEAIDAATDGATIKVAGYCADVTSVNNESQTAYINKNLTIRGGFSRAGWSFDPQLYPTTIDPRHKGRGITLGEVTVTLRDINLINGRVMGYGGGINAPGNSSLTLNNVKLANNTSVKNIGGGLFTDGALTAENSQFLGNWAYRGGGGALTEGTTVITGCLFQDNVASALDGGGLFSFRTLNLSGTRFINNRSGEKGGGLYLEGIEAGQNRIVNALFSGNSAGLKGGAISLFSYGVSGASAQIIHTTISGSSGTVSAIYAPNYTVGITNSIIDGYAVGIETSSSSVAAASEDYNLFNVAAKYGVSGTVTGGTNSLTGNPGFVDAAAGDYHLLAGSPAIDYGLDMGITSDLDGRERPSGIAPDMGAYEVESPYSSFSVRIAGASPVYFPTLTEVLDYASPGNILEARGEYFPETLTVNKVITLKGGFDGAYRTRNGYTIIEGLIIVGGSFTADKVIIQ